MIHCPLIEYAIVEHTDNAEDIRKQKLPKVPSYTNIETCRIFHACVHILEKWNAVLTMIFIQFFSFHLMHIISILLNILENHDFFSILFQYMDVSNIYLTNPLWVGIMVIFNFGHHKKLCNKFLKYKSLCVSLIITSVLNFRSKILTNF